MLLLGINKNLLSDPRDNVKLYRFYFCMSFFVYLGVFLLVIKLLSHYNEPKLSKQVKQLCTFVALKYNTIQIRVDTVILLKNALQCWQI